ncbi:hypothetical protein TPHA_0D03240 [Tetrapisispora phaffii CBS 4417]|uniref:Sphingoid long-chain base transporter RSB1 n=1 Tax=Tetrapisispora phaffii (strain ATCC 24235 / CBS 4417 / NBRC 1672 / NRRL Y-8282 / UCD 70-5) TaxID=1071381 RepID=G8BSY9_TETPH|nr:hypothetical protein TPHA_0D03240 [Tetrapisispora phaffii CBS 4417]CCE62960.1 hypothetical protein TPHA_0D03240 [Tetrapisispora phaffii CBS 4417]
MDIVTYTLDTVVKRANETADGTYNFYGNATPNLAFNVIMLVLYVVLLITHLILLMYKQYFFSWMMIFSIILQFAGYCARVDSHSNPYSVASYAVQSTFLIVAPVLFMGALYFQLAKLIEIYGHKYCLIRSPKLYSRTFISFDIFSFLIQAAGGGIVGSAASGSSDTTTGKNVFLAGDILQIVTMTVFIFFIFDFSYKVFYKARKIYQNTHSSALKLSEISQKMLEPQYRKKYYPIRQDPERFVFKYYVIAFSITVVLVYIRCFYRLVEFIEGQEGAIHNHEGYFIGFDGVLMMTATLLMTVFHPGFVFLGRKYVIPVTPGRYDPEDIEDISNTDEAVEETTSIEPVQKDLEANAVEYNYELPPYENLEDPESFKNYNKDPINYKN